MCPPQAQGSAPHQAAQVRMSLTSMRKSPVRSPALQATPSTSTDSRYCSAGKAGVGVNSSMGVSAAGGEGCGTQEDASSACPGAGNCHTATTRDGFNMLSGQQAEWPGAGAARDKKSQPGNPGHIPPRHQKGPTPTETLDVPRGRTQGLTERRSNLTRQSQQRDEGWGWKEGGGAGRKGAGQSRGWGLHRGPSSEGQRTGRGKEEGRGLNRGRTEVPPHQVRSPCRPAASPPHTRAAPTLPYLWPPEAQNQSPRGPVSAGQPPCRQ